MKLTQKTLEDLKASAKKALKAKMNFQMFDYYDLVQPQLILSLVACVMEMKEFIENIPLDDIKDHRKRNDFIEKYLGEES